MVVYRRRNPDGCRRSQAVKSPGGRTMFMKRMMLSAALLTLPFTALAEHDPVARDYDPSPLLWLGVGALVGHHWVHDSHRDAYVGPSPPAYHDNGHYAYSPHAYQDSGHHAYSGDGHSGHGAVDHGRAHGYSGGDAKHSGGYAGRGAAHQGGTQGHAADQPARHAGGRSADHPNGHSAGQSGGHSGEQSGGHSRLRGHR